MTLFNLLCPFLPGTCIHFLSDNTNFMYSKIRDQEVTGLSGKSKRNLCLY